MSSLYRIHRPTSFNEVVGQDAAVKELRSLLESNSLPHSLILVGGRGIGKTTLARIVAHELGTAPEDIYELDAASNRGVEDIRELRQNVTTLPLRSKFKVYILDEVHMLTTVAWNAFLKTLEEPPAHVKFLMATTELHQVPETIISRSRVIKLATPTVNDIAHYVTKIAKKENVTLTKDIAEIIAVSSNGSYRDSLVSLQTVIASNGKSDLTVKTVSQLLGVPPLTIVRDWLRALHAGDTATALTHIKTIEEMGSDVFTFLELSLARVRMVLAKRTGTRVIIENPEDIQLIDELLTNKPVSTSYLHEFVQALRMARTTPQPVVLLEIIAYKLGE